MPVARTVPSGEASILSLSYRLLKTFTVFDTHPDDPNQLQCTACRKSIHYASKTRHINSEAHKRSVNLVRQEALRQAAVSTTGGDVASLLPLPRPTIPATLSQPPSPVPFIDWDPDEGNIQFSIDAEDAYEPAEQMRRLAEMLRSTGFSEEELYNGPDDNDDDSDGFLGRLDDEIAAASGPMPQLTAGDVQAEFFGPRPDTDWFPYANKSVSPITNKQFTQLTFP
jgi:hypothetical protein